jgi:uncharacterized membrane protein YgcG
MLLRATSIQTLLTRGIAAGLFLLASMSPVMAREAIDTFHSEIWIGKDGSVDVTETIAVNAEDDTIRHGIVRNIPLASLIGHDEIRSHGLTLLSAKRDGSPDKSRIMYDDYAAHVYLGDEDSLLSPGRHVYELHYRTYNVIRHLAEQDALHWDVNGKGWKLDVDQISATIHLPPGAHVLQHTAYIGDEDERNPVEHNDVSDDGTIAFFATDPQAWSRQALSVDIRFPKGYVTTPPLSQRVRWYLQQHASTYVALGGAIVLGLFYWIVWYLSVRRRPDASRFFGYARKAPAANPSMPSIPPNDASPAVGMWLTLTPGSYEKGFTASIVDLAIRGYLTIDRPASPITIRRTGKTIESRALPPDQVTLLSLFPANGEPVVFDGTNRDAQVSFLYEYKEAVRIYVEDRFVQRHASVILPTMIVAMVIQSFSTALRLGTWLHPLVLAPIIPLVVSSVIHGYRAWRGKRHQLLNFFTWTLLALFVVQSFYGAMFVQGESDRTSWPMSIGYFMLAVIHVFAIVPLERNTLDASRYINDFLNVRHFVQCKESPSDAHFSPDRYEQFLPYAIAFNAHSNWTRRYRAHRHREQDTLSSRALLWSPIWIAAIENLDIDGLLSALTVMFDDSLATFHTILEPKVPIGSGNSGSDSSNYSDSGSSGGGDGGGGGGDSGGGGW